MPRLAFVAVLFALYAAQAQAQLSLPIDNINWCPTATVSRCQYPSFYAGPCGGGCAAVLQAEYERTFDSMPYSSWTVMTTPTTLGQSANQLVWAKPQPYDYSTHYASGGYAVYGATLERAKTAYLNPGWLTIDPRYAWRANGARSRSCEEWVWERYQSLHDFEDLALTLGNDYLSIFRLAYWPGWISNQPIRDSTGLTSGVLPFEPYSPKNGFFEALDLRMPPSAGSSTLTAYWKPIVDSGKNHYGWTWNLHHDMGEWLLARHTPERLEELYDLQKRHRELMKARRETYDVYERDYAKCRETGSVAACKPIEDHFASELAALDLGIGVSLTLATNLGCMNLSGWNACDWSPRRFFEMVQARIGVLREPDLARCKKLTGNRFGAGSLVAVVSASGLSKDGVTYLTPRDYAATPDGIAGMLVGIERYLSAFDWPKDSATGKPTLSAWKTDSQNLGNEWFGVEYGYRAGWGVTNTSVICETQAEVGAEAWAFGKVLKQRVPILEAKAWLSTKYDPASPASIDLTTEKKLLIAGQTLVALEKAVSSSGATNIVIDVTRPKDVAALTTYIVIMGVPVKLQAGAAGVMGLQSGLQGTLSRDCQHGRLGFEVGGVVKPFVGVTAFAQASIDAFVAEAGVRGELTLLRVDIPLDANVKTALDTQGQLSFSAGTKLGLKLKTLDGRISIFAKVAWRSTERTLVEWTGPSVDTTLFEYNFTPVPLALVNAHLSDGY